MTLPFFLRSAALAAAAMALVGATVLPAAAQDISTADKTAIEQIVHDYLIAHPEVIQEALAELDRRQTEAENAKRADSVAEASDVLFNSPRQVVLGNPDAKVALVEFFDYNCGYCKRALGDMQAILKDDKDVKIILKEFPILGPGSVEAAKVAVAVNLIAPEKYADFHNILLGGRGQADEAKALDAAEEAGLDRDKVKARTSDPEVGKTLEEAYQVAQKLGLSGTPTYVIGQEIVFGAVGVDELQSKIQDMRTCGKATC